MVIGKRNSYAQVQPIQDNIGQAMRTVEEMGLRYRAEEERKRQKKAAAEEKKQKELDANLQNFSHTNTGIYSLDNVGLGVANESARKSAELMRVIQSPTASREEKEKARLANFNLINQVKSSNQYMTMINEKKKEIQQQIEKGILNPKDEAFLMEDLKSLESMSIRVDDKGQWRFSTYETDESGNKKGVVLLRLI